MSEEEKRKAIEKEKSDRQSAQAKQAEAERASTEAAVIAAVSGRFLFSFVGALPRRN